MAKANVKKVEAIFYGTKNEWVVGRNPEKQTGSEFNSAMDIIAKDEKGYYFTHSAHVDSGLLDPFRCYKRLVPSQEILDSVIKPAVDVEEHKG